MKSRFIVNITLLLLVTILGLFIYFSENKNNSENKTLSSYNANNINSITIKHNGRITEIKKDKMIWKLTKPVSINANSFRINTLLNLLNTKTYARFNAKTLQLDKYGLDKPATSISFNKHQIDFGIINPFNNYRYVKLNKQVFLIDDHYYPLLSSQTGALVSRTLLPVDSKINKLVLPDQTLALNNQEKWISSKEISTDAILETLNHWKSTEAFGVHDYFERESLGSIEVYIDNVYEPIKFFITDVDPWLILARPDIQLEYHFNLELYDALLRPGAEKTLPEEFMEPQNVSPEEFMKVMNEQAKENARTP